jgi:hypothetical protein
MALMFGDESFSYFKLNKIDAYFLSMFLKADSKTYSAIYKVKVPNYYRNHFEESKIGILKSVISNILELFLIVSGRLAKWL